MDVEGGGGGVNGRAVEGKAKQSWKNEILKGHGLHAKGSGGGVWGVELALKCSRGGGGGNRRRCVQMILDSAVFIEGYWFTDRTYGLPVRRASFSFLWPCVGVMRGYAFINLGMGEVGGER